MPIAAKILAFCAQHLYSFPLQNMTVREFKERVSERVNLKEFSLIFAGKPLVDEEQLRFYHEEHCLCNQSTVFLCILLKGGCR